MRTARRLILPGVLLALLSTAMVTGARTTNAAPPNAPPGSVTTYQQNALHDGKGAGDLVPPLSLAWSANLGATVSYPLVVDGRVFVATSNSDGSYGAKLYAFDAESGSMLWGPIDLPGTYSINGIATDGTNVYSVNFNGLLRAFDAVTGGEVWQQQLPGQYAFTSPPAVQNGSVFVGGAGSGGTLYAVDAANGFVLWTASVANGDHSSPAVTAGGVYVSYACGAIYRFDPVTGQEIWAHPTHCSGGGGRTSVVHGDRLYVRDPNGEPPLVLATSDGSDLAEFSSGYAPAFDDNLAFYTSRTVSETTLTAVDLTDNEVVWSTSADGFLESAPIVVNGYVIVVSTMGNVFAFDEATGNQVWFANTGHGYEYADERSARMLVGLAAADGMLFVPATTTLMAYRSSTLPTPTTTGTSTLTPTPTPTPRPVAGVAFDTPSSGSGAREAWWLVAIAGAAFVALGGAACVRRSG